MSEGICPNCGALRPGNFCGECGQSRRDYTNSLPMVLNDAVREVFEFDGRLVRSIRTIFRHPGALAVAFAENRRASFVNPFRLFVFTTILWFFIFGATIPTPGERPQRPAEFEREIRQVDLLDTERQKSLVSEVQENLAHLRSLLDGDRIRKYESLSRGPEGLPRSYPVRLIADALHDNPGLWVWLKRVIANVTVDVVYSPAEMNGKLLDNLPIMMFVLLPWYALLLMLFYRKRGKRFIHHLVFAIHVHSFSFVVLSVMLLIPGSEGQRPEELTVWHQVGDFVHSVLMLAVMIHTYFAFKRFYEDGYLKTLVKYFGLGFMYLWGLIPAFTLVLALLLYEYL